MSAVQSDLQSPVCKNLLHAATQAELSLTALDGQLLSQEYDVRVLVHEHTWWSLLMNLFSLAGEFHIFDIHQPAKYVWFK